MGFIFRKRVGGRNAWINLSKTGASGSIRIGPFVFNSRGGKSVRLGKGLSYRFTKKSKRFFFTGIAHDDCQ